MREQWTSDVEARSPVKPERKLRPPGSMGILSLLAILPLSGCDGTGARSRGHAAATAYAAPLASDTSVVTARRVWSSGPGGRPEVGLYRSTIMPDGTGLATTPMSTGDLAVFDLASRGFSRFRFNVEPYDAGFASRPVASPDGSQIAFVWRDRIVLDRLEPGVQLRVVDVVTGESRTLLAPDTSLVHWLAPGPWTPSGDSVFAWLSPPLEGDGDVQIVLVPAVGGTPRLVHVIHRDAARMLTRSDNEWRMSLSPDGRWLLYAHELSRDGQTRSDIYIIDVQGGGARPLVEHPALDLLAGWLPGTDVVLFTSDRSGTTDLWSLRVVNGRASGEPRLVRSGYFRSEVLGFGNGALFYRVETGARGPRLINVDPQSGALLGSASPLLPGLGSAPPWGVAWSPDGQTLAALTRERGLRTVTLHSMETGESRVFRLAFDVTAWAMQWAADGKSLFLRAAEYGPSINPTHFLRLDLVTGTTARVFAATDPGFPDLEFNVAPDGRSIVVRQRRTLGNDRTVMMLVLRSIEDGRERELHRTSAVIEEFRVSPDGRHLAFVQHEENVSDSLFVLQMDGSQPLRAVASWDPPVSLLGWLPAGNALVAARLTADATGEEILRIGLDGSTTVVGFIPTVIDPDYYRSILVLSPAGTRLVQFSFDIGEELWRMDGLHELFVRDAAGRR
jgi:Tol biopolymer transport system component